MNKVILLGNLGRDPELRYIDNGQAIAKFPIATSEVWFDTEGKRQERTEWHNIVAWGKRAEACGKHLSKGSQVLIEGSIHSRSYDDKQGVKKYITEITARSITFLGGKQESNKEEDSHGRQSEYRDANKPSDDIPF